MNGKSEELTFTRDDAERIIRIEEKLDEVIAIKQKVDKNSIWISVFIWLIGGSSVIAALKISGII